MPVKQYNEQADKGLVYFLDDFGGGNIDVRAWGYGGSGGWRVDKLAALGGQVRLTIGGTAGNKTYLVQDTRLDFALPSSCAWRAKIENSTNMSAQLGYQTDSTHYIEFHADSAVSANWLCRCQNGGSATQEISGTAVDGNWHKLLISASSSQVLFFLDSTLLASITTNIPPGPFGPIAYGYRNAGGSGTRSYLVDWVEMTGPLEA